MLACRAGGDRGLHDGLLIYGANGYTGRLIAEAALGLGLRPLLCGRNAGRLARLAEELGGLAFRVVSLEDARALDSALSGVAVVLNAAGPFSDTASSLAASCLRTRTDYLDVTGEVDVLDLLSKRDAEASARGAMILPGVGFDVVPSDCLAAHVARLAPEATWLALGVRGLVYVSRGSYRTLVEQAGRAVRIRRDGELVETVPGTLRRSFDYGDEPRESLAVSWGDLVTAWHTTGIPNIEVYFEATPPVEAMLGAGRLLGPLFRTRTARALLKAQAEILPAGPSAEARASREAVLVAEAGDQRGRLACARLHSPEAYSFTGRSAATVASRVLSGVRRPGFQTPAGLLGPDFVTCLEGVRRIDVN
jgi:short subunit dehydrogenase-like uncharacterized protein